MSIQPQSDLLLQSALSSAENAADGDVLRWVGSVSAKLQSAVERVPLEALSDWKIDSDTGNLSHSSGKFFRIEGLEVWTNSGKRNHWSQPIINQPEIGILGFLAKMIDGLLHVLVQAKMEPGNINMVQISPTVQATRSNYTQVHGGRRPTFVEYFLGDPRMTVLLDQLQSEQGTRYLKKRNRNTILQVPDEIDLNASEDFRWMTLGQLQRLAKYPNLVHLDCRSILGSISYPGNGSVVYSTTLPRSGSFAARVLDSLLAKDESSEHSLSAVAGWITQHKCRVQTTAELIPLNHVDGWELCAGTIRHKSGCFFSIVGAAVHAQSREVGSWSQPLVHSKEGGILGLIAQMRRGVLHFLIQIRVEPGFIDLAELAPTVQCAPENYTAGLGIEPPPFVDLLLDASKDSIRFDSMLSEEGGRFYRSEQRHLIIELDANTPIDASADHIWMTLHQIQRFASSGNFLNIELRSILACLALNAP